MAGLRAAGMQIILKGCVDGCKTGKEDWRLRVKAKVQLKRLCKAKLAYTLQWMAAVPVIRQTRARGYLPCMQFRRRRFTGLTDRGCRLLRVPLSLLIDTVRKSAADRHVKTGHAPALIAASNALHAHFSHGSQHHNIKLQFHLRLRALLNQRPPPCAWPQADRLNLHPAFATRTATWT